MNLVFLLLAVCNPIPVDSVPTPTPIHLERDSLQMRLYDFANYVARLDGFALEPEQYAEAVMEVVACIKRDVEFSDAWQDYSPGEKAVEYWWITTFLMLAVVEQVFDSVVQDANVFLAEGSSCLLLRIGLTTPGP